MICISRAQARQFMLGHHGLNRFGYQNTSQGLQDLLAKLRCLQLDPLSPMGSSPDMVAIARVPDYRCNDWFNLLMPGHAFEHYAKERCLLPAYAYPYYRDHAVDVPWWRLHERTKKVPASVLKAVLAEVATNGPVSTSEMTDHGNVAPLDFSGWKGTGKVASMALDILSMRCQVVIAGRKNSREKLYDIPERALPAVSSAKPDDEFHRWAFLERIQAAGLLATTSGPHWSTINTVRTADLPHQLAEAGYCQLLTIEGAPQQYWAPADLNRLTFPEPDEHMRILAPLDPFIWNRKLIAHLFSFEYIWEVYKPANQRRWGWYVCPLLHGGRFVGRLEGRYGDGVLAVENVWQEPGCKIDRHALRAALKRHLRACGGKRFTLPRKFR